ncbi:MAG: 50S ribosome-binding GTPase, partial [Planctomycetes bacterium]|nr:50S ribosome-binding GTPase [Planctomycetota bacterium]
MERDNVTIALAGNPNSGKTTVFNNLTGSRQHVGNYPGVTVEKKEGYLTHKGHRVNIVDLPGTYSLTAYSLDEMAARDFIIEERPDVVVDIIDASNLERNLYLATQLLELSVPLVLVFNMSDQAERRGYKIDHEALSKLLGVPIVPAVATQGKGMDELLEAALAAAADGTPDASRVKYGAEIEEELAKIAALIDAEKPLAAYLSPRWTALKLLEADEPVRRKVEELARDPQVILDTVEKSAGHLHGIFGEDPEMVIADRRYGF